MDNTERTRQLTAEILKLADIGNYTIAQFLAACASAAGVVIGGTDADPETAIVGIGDGIRIMARAARDGKKAQEAPGSSNQGHA